MRPDHCSMTSEDLQRSYRHSVVQTHEGELYYVDHILPVTSDWQEWDGYEANRGKLGAMCRRAKNWRQTILGLDEFIEWLPDEQFVNHHKGTFAFLLTREPQRQWKLSFNEKMYGVKYPNYLEMKLKGVGGSAQDPFHRGNLTSYAENKYYTVQECEAQILNGPAISLAFSPKYMAFMPALGQDLAVCYLQDLVGTLRDGVIYLDNRVSFLAEDLSQYATVELVDNEE